MRHASCLLILLIFGISAAIHGTEAKELEGFGDEADDEFAEDDVEEEAPSVTIPRKAALHADIPAGQEAEEEKAATERSKSTISEEETEKSSRIPQPAAGQLPLKKPLPRDEWDEDEFEGVPIGYSEQIQSSAGPKPTAKQPAKPPPVRVEQPRKPMKAKDYIPEIAFISFLVYYGIWYLIGSSLNEKIALSWAEQFTGEGSLFEKNFSLLGTGDSNRDDDPLMIKDGQNCFKFYASGRRHCEACLVTLDLRARQDLLALGWDIIFPRKDVMRVDVFMNDEEMPPFIFAVTRKKKAKSYLKEHRDLKDLCSISDFSSKKKWPAEHLAVITDCREAANDLLNDIILDQLLGNPAFDKYAAEHFISMHFSDQSPFYSNKKKILRFEFSIPSPGKMEDVSRLVASVFYFIDTVGRLTLSATAKTKAEAARAKAKQADLKEQQEQRLEELQRRREERRRAEEARLTPEELARRKEKERLKGFKSKARMTRIH